MTLPLDLGTRLARRMLIAAVWVGCADGTASTASAQWTVVNLHPAGATSSEAHGVHGGQQVGWAVVGGFYRASLWTGSAASWVDLTPAGADSSRARGVDGGQQVGQAFAGGVSHASLWSGTAASWVDLHALLPAGFSWSEAHGIWHDATFTYVVGLGLNATAQRWEALMWVGPATGACYPNRDGSTTAPTLNILDFTCFLNRFGAGYS